MGGDEGRWRVVFLAARRGSAGALAAAVLVLLGAYAVRADGPPPAGAVLAIGGGSLGDEVLDRFVELARGKADGRIAVCPAASESPEGPEVARLEARGARAVEVVDFRSREEADDPARAARLEGAGGIFFTGGDQRRLLEVLRGSRALEALLRAFRRGAAIAGTSAGAAVLGEVAITGEGDGDRIRAGATPTVAGLGLIPGVIVDQHFLARRRHNRLVSALLANPGRAGVGVDEGTAVLYRAEGGLEAVGDGVVSVYVRAAGERAFSLRLLERGERVDLAR
jgi:cyanophycinase